MRFDSIPFWCLSDGKRALRSPADVSTKQYTPFNLVHALLSAGLGESPQLRVDGIRALYLIRYVEPPTEQHAYTTRAAITYTVLFDITLETCSGDES